MHAADLLGVVEIGKRARNAQDAMISACGKPHGVSGIAQQRKAGRVRSRHVLERRAERCGVTADVGQPHRRIALRLARASPRHALGHFPASFRRRRQDQIDGGHRRHFDVQVDAVEERSRKPHLVIRSAARIGPALAGKSRIIGTPAAAGIHGGNQHELRGISDPMVRPRNCDLAGLQRLAQ